MSTYEWLPSECADERYPMKLIDGALLPAGELDPVSIPAGKIVNNGWGEVGSRHIIGERLKPLPARVGLAWFSLTEDQFFAGEFDLPEAELRQAFTNGLVEPVTGAPTKWSKIIVGMGLGGWVSVWLSAGGVVRELTHATVEAVELDWRLVLDNPEVSRPNFIRATLRARLSEAALNAHAKHGPPVSTWPRTVQPYRWRLAAEGLQVPLDVYVRGFDGARSWYDFARSPPGVLERAPKQLDLTWLARSKRKHLTRIKLDERELFAAFDQHCGAEASGPPPTLRVNYQARGRVSVTLETAKDRLPLARTEVQLSSLAS